MAIIGTTIIDDVLSRQRDPNGLLLATVIPPTTTSGRAFVLLLLNHCQIFINLAERLMVGTSDLYLSPNTTVYDLTINAGSDYGGKVVGCNVTGVSEIDGPVDYKALGRVNRLWLTATDVNVKTAPLAWAPIGCTLIAFVPAFAAAMPPVVTIRYLKAPTFLPNEATDLTIPDYAAYHLARLVSLITAIKSRQLTDFDNRLEQLAKDIQAMDALQTTGGKAS